MLDADPITFRPVLRSCLAGGLALLGATADVAAAEPLRLHPDNPHYFLWRDRPTVLVTSGEHYGAVLNRDFDYKKYLATLESLHFNLTRTFTGAYCEHPGAFNIQRNTLAPAQDKLICPWARSDTPGYGHGGNKFDLTRYDPAYFKRLADFVAEAGRRGVVVELVFFCPFYKDRMWQLSPMNAANNVNGIGTMKREEVYTLKHPELLAVQQAVVRKIVRELRDADNLYYEICNEPYFGGVTLAWQARIATTIVEAEKDFKHKHLIAQNIANKSRKIEKPDPHVSIFNFHYAKPPTAVADNYHLRRPIGDDETGFAKKKPGPYRMEAWDFMLAGGAIVNNLDYGYTCGREDGTDDPEAPGSRGRAIQKQLSILKRFIESFEFTAMKPDDSVIKKVDGKAKTSARALVEPSQACAVYLRGQGPAKLALALPDGTYQAEWLDTKTGTVAKSERIRAKNGLADLTSPPFKDDIALSLRRRR